MKRLLTHLQSRPQFFSGADVCFWLIMAVCLLAIGAVMKAMFVSLALEDLNKTISIESQAIQQKAEEDLKVVSQYKEYAEEISRRIITGSGEVTFYHDKFHGRIAKYGSRFSQQGYTYANNTLPMGTACFFLRGEKLTYGVKTDTGELYGRFADLPRDRFAEIASLSRGVVLVDYVAILPQNGGSHDCD